MLLSDNVVQKIQDYENLKSFQVSFEKVTNIYSRIKLKSSSIEIYIDVEEQESYLSFILSHVKNGKKYLYYALSDYSGVSGDRLPLFDSSKEEKKFNERVARAVKKRRKMFAKDKNGDEIVKCILSFLNVFIQKLV